MYVGSSNDARLGKRRPSQKCLETNVHPSTLEGKPTSSKTRGDERSSPINTRRKRSGPTAFRINLTESCPIGCVTAMKFQSAIFLSAIAPAAGFTGQIAKFGQKRQGACRLNVPFIGSHARKSDRDPCKLWRCFVGILRAPTPRSPSTPGAFRALLSRFSHSSSSHVP